MVTPWSTQPVFDSEFGDCASLTFQVRLTSLLYQPFEPSGAAGVSVWRIERVADGRRGEVDDVVRERVLNVEAALIGIRARCRLLPDSILRVGPGGRTQGRGE